MLSIWHLLDVMRAIMPSAKGSEALMRDLNFHDEVSNQRASIKAPGSSVPTPTRPVPEHRHATHGHASHDCCI